MQLTRRELAAGLTALAPVGWGAPRANAAQAREGHALWAHPGDAGTTDASVREFADRCKRAGVDTIVMLVKHTYGEIYWRSRRFPQAIAKGYENFDLIEHLVPAAHARGMKVHAWLCDFIEGKGGAAFREHPEWAQVNADGKTTLTEANYEEVAMCPARRPGYTDQWLLPMIEEIASSYAVDGIHHDYVRYMGEVAPDSYCFCDYCLEHMPRHALLRWDTGSKERHRVEIIHPRMEANWEASPDMLPIDWTSRDRREKAEYLLNGHTIPGGPGDMRYFYYEYRVDQISRFVKEAWDRVKRINPKLEISAAVFKNPIQSARFIGQKWCDWTPWVDIFMPMTYRAHFLGSFEEYLSHLTEITARQKEWVGNRKPIWAGIATTYLYKEEKESAPGKFPPEKLIAAIRAARMAKPEGIAVFAAASLTAQNLWPALETAFREEV